MSKRSTRHETAEQHVKSKVVTSAAEKVPPHTRG